MRFPRQMGCFLAEWTHGERKVCAGLRKKASFVAQMERARPGPVRVQIPIPRLTRMCSDSGSTRALACCSRRPR
jgi:hypothetical protein